MADGKVVIDTALDNKGFTRGVSSLKGELGGLGGVVKKLGGIIAIAFSVGAIVNFGKESVKAASNLSSAIIGLQSIVEGQGRSFEQAKGFINSYIKDGLIPMQSAVTAYKNLAMRGYSTEQIEQTMIALKDASAFGRQASLTMGEAVSSATEGLKNENSILVDNSGVTKNVSVMWKEYANSIGVGVESLTKAQKIQAEVNGIMTETRFQTGDAAKVANTYAGQVSMLAFNFEQLKVAVGNAIIPIMKALLPSINATVAAVTELANAIGQITTALFGGEKAQSGLASGAEDTDSAIEDSVGNQEDLTGAIKDTEKEQKRSLAAFDEINKLSGESSAPTGGSDAPSTPPPTGPDVSEQVDGLAQKFQGLVDSMRKGFEEIASFAREVWSAFSESWDQSGQRVILAAKETLSGIIELVRSIGSAFAEVWTNGTGVTILNTIQSIISNVLDIAGALAERFRVAWEASGNGQAIWQSLLNIFQHVLDFVDQIVAATVTWAQGLNLEPIVSAFRRLLEALDPLVEIILDGLAWAYENVLLPLGKWTIEEAIPAVIDMLAEALNALSPVIEALEPLATWLWETFLKPLGEWTGEIIITAINGITWALQGFSDWARENQELIREVTVAIFTLLAGIVTFYAAQKIPQIIMAISTAFTMLATGIAAVSPTALLAAIALTAVASAIMGLAGCWDQLNGVQKVVAALGAIIAVAFAAALAVGAFQSALTMGIAVAAIAAGIIAMTAVIASAKSQAESFNASSFSATTGRNSAGRSAAMPSVTEYNVPALARGAVIPPNREFLAILGDQPKGTNIEAPVSEIEAAVARGVAQGGGAPSELTIIVKPGHGMTRYLSYELDAESKLRGIKLVKGAT